VGFLRFGVYSAAVAHVRAAVVGAVAIQKFAPVAWPWERPRDSLGAGWG
jgi:hypothetical protein